MKRLAVMLAVLLAACTNYADLLSAVYAPVTDDPATPADEYILPGAIHEAFGVQIPPDVDVLGTYRISSAPTVIFQTDAAPATVFDYYRSAYPDFDVREESGERLRLCKGSTVIEVHFHEDFADIHYSEQATPICLNPLEVGPDPSLLLTFIPPTEGNTSESIYPGTASRTTVTPHEGRSVEQWVADFTERSAAEGWQPAAETLTPTYAWGVWQQTDEQLGPLQLDITITLSAEDVIINARVTQLEE